MLKDLLDYHRTFCIWRAFQLNTIELLANINEQREEHKKKCISDLGSCVPFAKWLGTWLLNTFRSIYGGLLSSCESSPQAPTQLLVQKEPYLNFWCHLPLWVCVCVHSLALLCKEVSKKRKVSLRQPVPPQSKGTKFGWDDTRQSCS